MCPKGAAESHETTVYRPASAVGELAKTIAVAAAPPKALTRRLRLMPLIYSAEARHARDNPSSAYETCASCVKSVDYKLSLPR